MNKEELQEYCKKASNMISKQDCEIRQLHKAIDKAIETLEWGIKSYHNSGSRTALFEVISDSKSILKEVSE